MLICFFNRDQLDLTDEQKKLLGASDSVLSNKQELPRAGIINRLSNFLIVNWFAIVIHKTTRNIER